MLAPAPPVLYAVVQTMLRDHETATLVPTRPGSAEPWILLKREADVDVVPVASILRVEHFQPRFGKAETQRMAYYWRKGEGVY